MEYENENTKDFYTVNEFAKILNVTPQTIRKGIKANKIKAFRLTEGVKPRWHIPLTEYLRLRAYGIEN